MILWLSSFFFVHRNLVSSKNKLNELCLITVFWQFEKSRGLWHVKDYNDWIFYFLYLESITNKFLMMTIHLVQNNHSTVYDYNSIYPKTYTWVLNCNWIHNYRFLAVKINLIYYCTLKKNNNLVCSANIHLTVLVAYW